MNVALRSPRCIALCAGVGQMSKDAHRRWRERHPERAREATRKSVAKWRAANPETSKEGCRDHYARNREAILAQKRDYYQRVRKVRDATPEGRLKDLNRKHLRRSREGGRSITMPEWLMILEQHGHACAYCKSSSLPLEMDHVVPLSKGGKHCPSNIVPACKPCNSSKGAR